MDPSEQTFVVSLIRYWSPTGTTEVTLSSLIRLAQAKRWSHIEWDADEEGILRRRKAAFKSSSLIVVDLDVGKDGRTIDLNSVIETIERHRLRGFLLNGRRRGNYTLVIVPERPMVTAEEHRATHLYWCGLFDGDIAFCDAVDFCKARRKPGNKSSGTVVWQDLSGGSPASVIRSLPSRHTHTQLGISNNQDKCDTSHMTHGGVAESDTTHTHTLVLAITRTSQVEWWLRHTPAAVSGYGGDERVWKVILAAGHALHSIGAIDLLPQMIREVYNPRCDPPWTEAHIDAKTAKVVGYSAGWETSRPTWLPRIPRERLKHETLSCKCGCGFPVEQNPGRGRRRVWATGACAKRYQRALTANNANATVKEKVNEREETTAVELLDYTDKRQAHQRSEQGEGGRGDACTDAVSGIGCGPSASDPDAIGSHAVLHRPCGAIDDGRSGARWVLQEGPGIRSCGEATLSRATGMGGPTIGGKESGGPTTTCRPGAGHPAQVPTEMRVWLWPGHPPEQHGKAPVIHRGSPLPTLGSDASVQERIGLLLRASRTGIGSIWNR